MPEATEAARALGAALRHRRMARGLSLRSLARQVGLTTHGTLVDYEHGRRIPPEDLVLSCEKVLEIDDGELRRLRSAALSARAGVQASALLDDRPPAPSPAAPPATRPSRSRWWLAPAAVLLLVAAGLVGALIDRAMPGHPSEAVARPLPAGQLRFGFETPNDRWGILWGHHKATGKVTDSLHYEGSHSYEVTMTGASSGTGPRAGYVAFGTTHGVESLHSGMRITMRLWTSYPQNGVRFFVFGPHSQVFWAPETPHDGSELPVSGGQQWSTLTWTVPQVPQVIGIGVQPYAENDEPRVVAIDAVSW